MALIHKYTSSDAQYLVNEAKSGKDVNIIDCMYGTVEKNVLKLRFYAPLKFLVQGYKITIALSRMGFLIHANNNESMTALSIPYVQYNFKPTHSQHFSFDGSDSLGNLISHICEGDVASSEVSFSDSAMAAKTSNEISVKKLVSNEIEVSCGPLHTCILKYRYPINYDGIKIKLSRKTKIAQIICPRLVHQFDEEDPAFIASPDHQLSLPPWQLSMESMIKLSGMQNSEIAVNRDHALMPPLLNVKETFIGLFQHKMFYFQIKSPQNVIIGYIIINNHLFDYYLKTPVLDIAFTFLDDCEGVLPHWNSVMKYPEVNYADILVDDAEYPVLKKTLMYFAKRTNGSCQTARSSSRLNYLCRVKIDGCFTRAVIYFLYGDPDHTCTDFVNAMPKDNPVTKTLLEDCKTNSGNPDIDEKCDYCGKCCPNTKKCSKCKKVQYCNDDCQTKHWQEHCKNCITISKEKAGEKVPKCSHCEATSPNLKKCTQCGKVQYCGKKCQSQHWSVHKLECKKTKEDTSPRLGADEHTESCSYCGCYSPDLVTCTRCRSVKYCDKKCQKGDWKKHRITCK